jgi:ABC-2 type transport system permease protein
METLNTVLQRTSFVFAGQIAPVALMPESLRAVCYALPFYYVLGAPVEILRGEAELGRALFLIGAQALWLALAWWAFRVSWRRGLAQYSAVGA